MVQDGGKCIEGNASPRFCILASPQYLRAPLTAATECSVATFTREKIAGDLEASPMPPTSGPQGVRAPLGPLGPLGALWGPLGFLEAPRGPFRGGFVSPERHMGFLGAAWLHGDGEWAWHGCMGMGMGPGMAETRWRRGPAWVRGDGQEPGTHGPGPRTRDQWFFSLPHTSRKYLRQETKSMP